MKKINNYYCKVCDWDFMGSHLDSCPFCGSIPKKPNIIDRMVDIVKYHWRSTNDKH